jgi:hypothetical protein
MVNNRSYGIDNALQNVFPQPIISASAPPATNNGKYPLGQQWINTSDSKVYILANVTAGVATWSLASPGASEVDTLTGDSGGALSPTAGNITLAGGTNLTTSGSGSTLTFNLDDAITLATSVTSPIYTVAAATDLAVNAVTGQNIIMKMGDASGVQKVSFVDSASAEVASIDSNGGFTTTGLTFTGLLTANASATINTAGTQLQLGTDNSGDAVKLALGTVARTVSIANSAAAHLVTIGSTTGAAALTLHYGTGNLTVDGAATSNATLFASATTGTVTIGGTAQTGDFGIGVSSGILTGNLFTGNGAKTLNVATGISGNTVNLASGINTSAQVINVSTGAAAADSTVNILTGNASAGTITLNMANGNRATAVNLGNGTGGNTILIGNGVNAALQTISIANGASGADQTVNVLSGNGAAGTQTLNLAQGTGGKTVNIAAGAGANLVTIGSATTTSTTAILGGSVGLTLDATGVVEINSSAGVIGIGNDAVAQNINVGTGAAARTITVGNTTGATSVVVTGGTGAMNFGAQAVAHTTTIGSTTGASVTVIQSGTGKTTMTGTVQQIDANLVKAAGDYITFDGNCVASVSGQTGGAPSGTTAAVNILGFRNLVLEQFVIGAGQTLIVPILSTANANYTGVNVAGDQTDTEGFEYNWGAANVNSRNAFTIGTSAAFFLEWQFQIEDVSGAGQVGIGFRKSEANNATMTSYTDYAWIGMSSADSATAIQLKTELNSGGTTTTNTTDAWADAAVKTLRINVSAAGVVTYLIDGVAPSVTAAFTFDTADVVVPYFRCIQSTDLTQVAWRSMRCGFQP